jgi:hypothetical protein
MLLVDIAMGRGSVALLMRGRFGWCSVPGLCCALCVDCSTNKGARGNARFQAEETRRGSSFER